MQFLKAGLFFFTIYTSKCLKEFDIAWRFFNWRNVTATATTLISHARLRIGNASTKLLYQTTGTLKHYLLQGSILTGFHQPKHIFKMDSTAGFSRYPRAISSSKICSYFYCTFRFKSSKFFPKKIDIFFLKKTCSENVSYIFSKYIF